MRQQTADLLKGFGLYGRVHSLKQGHDEYQSRAHGARFARFHKWKVVSPCPVTATVRREMEPPNVLQPKYIVYEDGVISFGLHAESSDDDENDMLHAAIKWMAPEPMKSLDGTTCETTNLMGGETPWFLLPHTFGAEIGKKLVEQKVAGLDGFNDAGFNRLVQWLIEMEHLDDTMCY